MQLADIEQVWQLQSQTYPPELWEPASLLAQRLSQCPDMAWVLYQSQQLCAYLTGYRSQLGALTALSSPFEVKPQGNCLYLHDLCVGTAHQGQGLASQLIDTALTKARHLGLSHCALISVQDSRHFWQRYGFSQQLTLNAQQQQRLSSYPSQAYYLSQNLTPG